MSEPAVNPYDDVPYRSFPIDWTAPERLALTSLLHGGPRLGLGAHRVLEVGCGDGANLLPLAYYRRASSFVGVDASARAVDAARARAGELALGNASFIQSDFRSADDLLDGAFDVIVAHGVFSWIPNDARDALLRLCARRLRPGGLLYLNYNALPGWTFRGTVREFLLAQTATIASLAERTARAQEAAAKMAASFGASEDGHPYAKLMEREFRFVAEGDASYVAHEFLAPENHAYWRSDFAKLTSSHGFLSVADADFNYPWSRTPDGLSRQLHDAGLVGRAADDTLDLVSYRQLHSPLLTNVPFEPRPPSRDELTGLVVAACLAPAEGAPPDALPRLFRHPTGFEVEAKDEVMARALERLAKLWPRGAPMRDLIGEDAAHLDHFLLLHRHRLIELRLCELTAETPAAEPLNRCEASWGGYETSPYHDRRPSR